MKDIIITKIIPKTHKSVLLFLLFTFFLGFFIFITLLEGLRIDHLTLGGVKVEKLYLKWDKALHIKASKIDLTDLADDDTPLTLEPLSRLPRIINITKVWIDSIQIDIIQYKEHRGSLLYRKNQLGRITLGTSSGNFLIDEKEFRLSLPELIIDDSNISANLYINLANQHLISNIALTLPQTPRIEFSFFGDSDTLRFSAKTNAPLASVKPLIDFLHMDPEVTPWIVEYAKASSIQLNRFEGVFHYDKPDELLTTLIADATVIEGAYTFALGFEPIYAPQIDLRFVKGKLHIFPKNGTFYSLPTQQSHVVIDFTTPHTMLDAYIKTDKGRLNDPILSLLDFYDIHLPIKQNKGECNVDLHLSINLYDLETTVKGIFLPGASEILLDKIPLETQGGIVKVDRNHVTFENFIAHYGEDIAHARVDGEYDASSERGIVSINAYAVTPLAKNLALFDPRDPLRVTYIIAPEGDILNVNKSNWNLAGEKLTIEGFRTPFDYRRAFASIHSIPFSISKNIKGTINATFNGSEKRTDLKLRLQEFKFGEIKLQNAPFDVDMHYINETAKITIKEPSAWSVHQLPLLISPFNATFKNDFITFDQIDTVFGDLFKGRFSGMYRMDTEKGAIRLSNMVPLSPKILPIIESKESLDLIINTQNDTIRIDAPTLKAHFTTVLNGWKIGLGDISLLSNKSPILRRYNINNGYLNLYYTGKSSLFHFNGEIDYLYPLMVLNDVPISHYRFSGTHQDDTSNIRVNDRLVINQTPTDLYIRGNNTGINIPVLFKFLSAHTDKNEVSSKTDTSLPIRIHATNSYLYLMKGRKIVADTLDATVNNDNFDATLRHMDGSAVLKIRNNLFSIDGVGFNDKFMGHLFALSDFSGGNFSFQAKGKTDSFDGLMRVENTILKDYKVLNNVLAFVNTVPSLATFSLPNYNSKGLPVNEGYAHFAYQKGVVSVDNFTLNSPEMKITGTGRADFNSNQLDGILTLKTDLGSALGKVPMVGYILLGDDGSLATTLTLSGKLDDPKIDTAIAKEIVTAPFNILKRTLVYPFLWMMDDKKEK